MVFFKGWEPPGTSDIPCAYCRGPVPPEGRVRCKRCKVVYHPDCWTANRSRCAVYGCEPGAPARVPVPTGAAAPARSGGGSRNWVWIVVVISAVARLIPASHHSSKPSPVHFDHPQLHRDWNIRDNYAPPDFKALQPLDLEGDIENSIPSYTMAIHRNPMSVRSWEGRAYLHYDRAEWEEALVDFRQALQLQSPRSDYLRLRIWLIQARTGRREEGDLALKIALMKRIDSDEATWEDQIAEYLLGRRSEADLLAQAGTPGRECQVLYYIGSRRLVDGDPDEARNYFLKCEATGKENYREYQSAAAELR